MQRAIRETGVRQGWTSEQSNALHRALDLKSTSGTCTCMGAFASGAFEG